MQYRKRKGADCHEEEPDRKKKRAAKKGEGGCPSDSEEEAHVPVEDSSGSDDNGDDDNYGNGPNSGDDGAGAAEAPRPLRMQQVHKGGTPADDEDCSGQETDDGAGPVRSRLALVVVSDSDPPLNSDTPFIQRRSASQLSQQLTLVASELAQKNSRIHFILIGCDRSKYHAGN